MSCSEEIGHGVQAKIALEVSLPGPAQCPDGAFGKPQARFGFVLQNNGIVDGVPRQRVQTHHVPRAFRSHGNRVGPTSLFHMGFQGQGGSRGRVLLVGVVHLVDGRLVPFEQRKHAGRFSGDKVGGVHAWAEVGAPKPKISSIDAVVSFLTLAEDFFFGDLVTFSAFFDNLFVLSTEDLLFEERIFLTSSKVNARLSFFASSSVFPLAELLEMISLTLLTISFSFDILSFFNLPLTALGLLTFVLLTTDFAVFDAVDFFDFAVLGWPLGVPVFEFDEFALALVFFLFTVMS